MGAPKRKAIDGKLQCSKCKEWRDPEMFYLQNHTSTGRGAKCKVCSRTGRKKQVVVDGKKQCSKCKKWLTLDWFYRCKITSTGLDSACKKCQVRKTNKTYSYSHSTFLNAMLYGIKNPRTTRGRRLALAKDNQLTEQFIHSLWDRQGGKCAVTGMPMTHERGNGRKWTNASLDRIDSSVGYTEENVRLVCVAINLMKNNMSHDEFLFWCHAALDGSESKNELEPILSA